MAASIHRKISESELPMTSHSLRLNNFRLGRKYLIFDLLAAGKNSAVYYGVDERTKEERAFKFYNLKQIQELRGFKEKEICKRMSNYEYQIMSKCKSINILRCQDIYEDRNYKIMVYEYCQMSLLQEINNRDSKQISQIRAILTLKQILSALRSMHLDANVLHINLQPKNIMFKNGIYKLIDFGFPSVMGMEEEQDSNNLLAPEIIKRRPYDQKAEVWSIGVLFHQILYGVLPQALQSKRNSVHSSKRTLFQTRHLETPPSKAVAQFLQRCLYYEPEERMTIDELQGHSMFDCVRERKPKVEKCPIIQIQDNKEFTMPEEDNRMSVCIPISQENQYEFERERGRLDQFFRQTFNLDLFRKQIERELQKTYEKLGESFQIQELQRTSIEYLKGQINKEQEISYKLMKDYYLQCLKVEFIYFQIIKPLWGRQSKKLQRQTAQLFCLILGTCFTAMSMLNDEQKNKEGISEYQNLLQICVTKSTALLYNTIKQKWEKCCNRLHTIQDNYVNRIFDKLAQFTRGELESKKNLYLGGFQKLDFNREDKIQFSFQFYKQNQERIQKQTIPEQQFQGRNRALKYLGIYVKLWSINADSSIEQKYPSLKSYIDKQILGQILKQERKSCFVLMDNNNLI